MMRFMVVCGNVSESHPERIFSMRQAAQQTKAIVLAGCLVLGGVFSLAPPTADSADICGHPKPSGAKEYWFWEVYFGVRVVRETERELFWHPNDHLVFCYRIEKNELENSAKRVHGYKEAIVNLIQWLAGLEDPEWGHLPPRPRNREVIRQKLQKLTGETFSASGEWDAWWRENNEYLEWDDSTNRIVVDEEAKRDQTPINEEIVPFSAEDYWLSFALGRLKEIREEGEFLRAWEVVGPPFVMEGVRSKIRVPKAEVTDRIVKQRAYLKGMAQSIPYPASGSTYVEEIFMERLRRLTGENFKTSPEWVRWWEKNKDHLVLSDDGERLIVDPENKPQPGK
jgi:hypothetical protein